MDISRIEMDHINIQNTRPKISALEGFPPQNQGNTTKNSKNNEGDSFEADGIRQVLRELCESGQAESHVADIINSNIEPDCLRAELSYRNDEGDKAAVSIIINYLAGDFKEAMLKTQQLAENDKTSILSEFMFISNYFSGNFETACDEAKNLNELLNMSPLLSYFYADMLLSLGFIEEARAYTRKYVFLARKYLKNFVSEKEKYEQEKKRREQNSQRNRQGNRNGDSAEAKRDITKSFGNTAITLPPAQQNAQNDLNADNSTTLLELLGRRKILHAVIGTRNVSYDKRELMFELEDIDARIGQLSGRQPQL